MLGTRGKHDVKSMGVFDFGLFFYIIIFSVGWGNSLTIKNS